MRSTRPAFALVSDAAGERLPGDVDGGRDRLAVAIAASYGHRTAALEMAVDYARERQQFGRPIGAYQAVGHRCAGMLLATEESRSLTYYAAWAADAEPESLPMAAAMAAARAGDAGWQVPASALQVFGGIGFTWEHDLQFWLKRGRVEGSMLGTPRDHRERVADLSGLGAGESRSDLAVVPSQLRDVVDAVEVAVRQVLQHQRSTPTRSSSASRSRTSATVPISQWAGSARCRPRDRLRPRRGPRRRRGPLQEVDRSDPTTPPVISEITGRGLPAFSQASAILGGGGAVLRVHHHQVVLVGPAAARREASRPGAPADDQVGR